MTQVKATATVMTCVNGKRQNAFYNVYTVGNRTVFHYGPQGKDGRSDIKGHPSAAQARDAAQKKISDKSSGGYKIISRDDFDVSEEDVSRLAMMGPNAGLGSWLNKERVRNLPFSATSREAQQPSAHVSATTILDPLDDLNNTIRECMTAAATAATDAERQQVTAQYVVIVDTYEKMRSKVEQMGIYKETLEDLIVF